jgi:hypothetical protein
VYEPAMSVPPAVHTQANGLALSPDEQTHWKSQAGARPCQSAEYPIVPQTSGSGKRYSGLGTPAITSAQADCQQQSAASSPARKHLSNQARVNLAEYVDYFEDTLAVFRLSLYPDGPINIARQIL